MIIRAKKEKGSVVFYVSVRIKATRRNKKNLQHKQRAVDLLYWPESCKYIWHLTARRRFWAQSENRKRPWFLLLLPPHTAAVKFPERLSELRSVKFVFYWHEWSLKLLTVFKSWKRAHSYLPTQLPKRQRWELSEDEDEDEIVYFVVLLVPLCFLLQGQKKSGWDRRGRARQEQTDSDQTDGE